MAQPDILPMNKAQPIVDNETSVGPPQVAPTQSNITNGSGPTSAVDKKFTDDAGGLNDATTANTFQCSTRYKSEDRDDGYAPTSIRQFSQFLSTIEKRIQALETGLRPLEGVSPGDLSACGSPIPAYTFLEAADKSTPFDDDLYKQSSSLPPLDSCGAPKSRLETLEEKMKR
jgi:hypothetical protein